MPQSTEEISTFGSPPALQPVMSKKVEVDKEVIDLASKIQEMNITSD